MCRASETLWETLADPPHLPPHCVFFNLILVISVTLIFIFPRLVVINMSAVAIGASSTRRKSSGNGGGITASTSRSNKSSSSNCVVSERESGFHEPVEFLGGASSTPGGLYGTTESEHTHLLAYKSAALNHINSNHVNHHVLRSSHNNLHTNATTSHTSAAFLEIPQPSIPLTSALFPAPGSLIPGQAAPSPAAASFTSSSGSSGDNQRGAAPLSPHHHDCKVCGCERIKINVSGQYFETRVGLLNRHPDTLLGNPKKRQRFYDRTRDEFFIDRHRPSFEAIFSYYQYGGKLKRPHTVPDEIFLSEVVFYELERDVVEEYKQMEGYVTEKIDLPTNECFKKVWLLFEYPESSIAALIVAIVSVIATLVSIVLFCVETLPVFSMSHCVVDAAPNFLDPFFIIETLCTIWFTLELIIRFIVCPSKVRFWRDFKNLVDATAIIPYYVTFINVVSTMSCASAKSSASLAFLRVIRLIRVFKLTKHSVGLQVLILTFKASIGGLGLFLVALVVCLLVFSSAIYYAELGIKNSQIQSIPDAFWWAIITMTTVGYGDKVPIGPWGKLLGSVCALVGVLTLAIPVPIITGNFNRFYIHKTGRGRQM